MRIELRSDLALKNKKGKITGTIAELISVSAA